MTEQIDKISVEMFETKSQKIGRELLNKIVQCLITNGKLLIVGINGHGKTNAMKHILRFIMNTQEYKDNKYIIRITDTTNVWKWSFDSIPFVDIVKKSSIPEDAKTLLLDLGFEDSDANVRIIENMLRGDWILQRESINTYHGQIPIHRITAIEEIQLVAGSYSLNGKSGRFFFKVMSEGRNLGMYIIGTTQRFADVSTKICERTRYFLLGAVSGSNDITKIARMFPSDKGRKVTDCLLSLKRSEFLFLDKENPEEGSFIIYFPQFEPVGKPYEFEEKIPSKVTAKRAFL